MMAIAPSTDVSLEVRQHPQHALVTPENKEKSEQTAGSLARFGDLAY